MSDLTSPPRTLLPPAPPAVLAWPAPALAVYASGVKPGLPIACRVEARDGGCTEGELLHFDPAADGLRLSPRDGGRELHLRTEQILRVQLLEPLTPGATAAGDAPDDASGDPHGDTARAGTRAAAELLAQRPLQPFEIELRGQATWHGHTVAAVQEAHGLFLFEPLDDSSRLRCWYVPHAACHHAEIGMRIGQALVDQHSATPEQIRTALLEQEQLRQRRLGEMLVERQIITADELAAAIDRQARMPLVRIGEALTALGCSTEAQLEDALVQQRSDRSLPLGELLLRQGLVSRQDLQTALARKMGYPLVDVEQFPPDPQALARLPQAQAARWLALPLMVHGGRLVLALEDPSSRSTLEQLAFAAQCRLVPVLARADPLLGAIDRAYARLAPPEAEPVPVQVLPPADDSPSGKGAAAAVGLAAADQRPAPTGADASSGAKLPAAPDGGTAEHLANTRWLQTLLQEARGQHCAVLHLECDEPAAAPRVRLRVDGRLQPSAGPAAPVPGPAVLAWLKQAAGWQTPAGAAQRQGLFTGLLPNPAADTTAEAPSRPPGGRLHLSVLPTCNGTEDAVLRLPAAHALLSPDALGLSPRLRPLVDVALRRRGSLLLVAGPAGGGGRHGAMHALLSTLNTPGRKVCTAEDPVHTLQPGVRQWAVDPQADFNFAQALRALGRADADAIAVGELRDADTAQLALQAARAGRQVLSTLPSPRASDALAQLLELGLAGEHLANHLAGVLAQRLVPRLCPHCRQPAPASAEEEEELLHEHLQAVAADAGIAAGVFAAGSAAAASAAAQASAAGAARAVPQPAAEVLAGWRQRWGNAIGQLVLQRPVGCSRCRGSGYLGRTGVHEWLGMTPALRAALRTGSSGAQGAASCHRAPGSGISSSALRTAWLCDGGQTLGQDGLEKVLAGVTTLADLRTVL